MRDLERRLPEMAEGMKPIAPKDRHKLHALHAPEVECIGKGDAR